MKFFFFSTYIIYMNFCIPISSKNYLRGFFDSVRLTLSNRTSIVDNGRVDFCEFLAWEYDGDCGVRVSPEGPNVGLSTGRCPVEVRYRCNGRDPLRGREGARTGRKSPVQPF